MSADVNALIARALKQRERWVDLQPGKRVLVRRPPELDLIRLRMAGRMSLDELSSYAVAWEGVTLQDMLGDDEAPEPLEFDRELWLHLRADRADWASAAGQAVLALIEERATQREAAEKN
jgi:hypothetical protein